MGAQHLAQVGPGGGCGSAGLKGVQTRLIVDKHEVEWPARGAGVARAARRIPRRCRREARQVERGEGGGVGGGTEIEEALVDLRKNMTVRVVFVHVACGLAVPVGQNCHADKGGTGGDG